MNRKSYSVSLYISLILLALVITVFAEDKTKAVINVTTPRDGAVVGRESIVKGTAFLPRGHYLWVLVRRVDFDPLWWPQGEAKVDPITHEWSATAYFGMAQDIGQKFEVAVISVDEKQHMLLKDYWVRAMRTGEWRPIELPEGASVPHTLKVLKKS